MLLWVSSATWTDGRPEMFLEPNIYFNLQTSSAALVHPTKCFGELLQVVPFKEPGNKSIE